MPTDLVSRVRNGCVERERVPLMQTRWEKHVVLNTRKEILLKFEAIQSIIQIFMVTFEKDLTRENSYACLGFCKENLNFHFPGSTLLS